MLFAPSPMPASNSSHGRFADSLDENYGHDGGRPGLLPNEVEPCRSDRKAFSVGGNEHRYLVAEGLVEKALQKEGCLFFVNDMAYENLIGGHRAFPASISVAADVAAGFVTLRHGFVTFFVTFFRGRLGEGGGDGLDAFVDAGEEGAGGAGGGGEGEGGFEEIGLDGAEIGGLAFDGVGELHGSAGAEGE